MRDLRLIGVHDDGEHLVVADDDGQEYRIRIDEQLRAAARRDRPRLGQLQIEIDSTVRPREVQAMIRAGASAEEVAARTGWSLDKIARFEGPVLAEREHVAQAAQRVRLRGQTGTGTTETLGGRATSRLAQRAVTAESVRWDSARDADGQWTVSAAFTAGGKERTATWWFDTHGMSVVPKNDEAKWLSEADSPEGVVPTPHRPTAVFDVEADSHRGPDELMATMREQAAARGRRRTRRKAHVEPPLPLEGDDQAAAASTEADPQPVSGEAESSTATSPTSLPDLPPAARGTHPLDEPAEAAPDDAPDETPAESVATDDADGEAAPEVETTDDADGEAAPEDGTTDAADPAADPQGGSASEDESEAEVPDTASGPPASEDVTKSDGTPDEDPVDPPSADSPTPPARPAPKRKGRASVPSWDDVMFGKRRSDTAE